MKPINCLCAYLLLPVALSGCALPAYNPPTSFLGDSAPVSAATETRVLGPDTRTVNVTGGDTVKFVSNGKEFAWVFNVASNVRSFNLQRIAPPGVLNHPVIVYVAPDPRYIGGGDRSDK